MTPQEKRKAIIDALTESIKENGLSVEISSPKIKFFCLGSKSGTQHYIEEGSLDSTVINKVEKNMHEYRESTLLRRDEPEAPSPAELDEQPETEDEEPIDYEDLSYKDFKKLKKEQKKEERDQYAEQKRLIKIRKDAHKRGFDTTVLMQFDDPEEFYEMSDEEITRLQAAGYINEDGFYDFVFPPDADSLKKEKLSMQKKLMIAGLIFFGAGILTWVFISFYSTFSFV